MTRHNNPTTTAGQPGGGARASRRRDWAFAALLCTVALLTGCAGGGPSGQPLPGPAVPAPASSASAVPAPGPHTAADGRGAIRPLPAPSGCTATVTDPAALKQATSTAQPGTTLCVLGNFGDTRLSVNRSGTAQAPIRIAGDGNTTVKGITVDANFVAVSGINASNPHAPGISLKGTGITLENSTSISPRGDDGDGIRFWGSGIVIRHNTIAHTRNAHKAHADCMQTFATDEDSPASQHILIEANRCEDISNTCLIMEGPNSEAGDGSGVGASFDVTWTDNYCDNRADEALQIDDVQNLAITNNEIAGTINHAFALQNNSTGARVSGNTLNPDIRYEVGIDDSSKPGYQGPPPGGSP